jgi:hypothetical protein
MSSFCGTGLRKIICPVTENEQDLKDFLFVTRKAKCLVFQLL